MHWLTVGNFLNHRPFLSWHLVQLAGLETGRGYVRTWSLSLYKISRVLIVLLMDRDINCQTFCCMRVSGSNAMCVACDNAVVTGRCQTAEGTRNAARSLLTQNHSMIHSKFPWHQLLVHVLIWDAGCDDWLQWWIHGFRSQFVTTVWKVLFHHGSQLVFGQEIPTALLANLPLTSLYNP